MGKPKPQYTYSAYQEQDGKWVAFLLEDPRLKVFGHSEQQALKEIQTLHRDVLEANRFIERKEVTE